MEPPSFPAGGPQTVRAAPGSDAHLVVPAPSGTAPFHYQWSRAGAALEGRFASSEEPGAVRLTVSAARTDDTGLYTLQASNAAGSDTARVRLEVSADEAPTGEDPPTFLRRLQDLTVKVGTRTRFLVEILSNTECKVTWYRNERRLLEAERVSLARDGNFWCADVAAVSVDDAGRWTCTAENAGGRASCSAHLNVLVPKAYKRPEFVEELRALLTELGTVSLECKVVGVPTPVLRWFKDSREIKAGDVFALTANADDPTSLGTYTCEAVNCMGRAYSSSKVHVVGRASREGSTRPAASGITGEPPPIFTRELEDQFARICEPLTLSCQVVVPPWPRSVVWYNKEGKVEPSERYHVLEDGVGGYMLEIPSAEWADEGEWKCVATSSGGRVGISTCIVSMDVPKNYRKPRFMENLQAVLTEEGLVSFECKVVGFPTPVLSWFKDGQELKPGDVYQLTGTNSLGSYCCIARNCMGQASSSAELTVEDIQNQLNEEEKLQLFSKNQAPKFVQGLKSVESKIDEPFRFTIKVAIPPEPSVLWYRDDQPVDESTRCHLGKEERGVFFLDIENLEFLDQAEWKCVAMNDFGHSVTSCFLKLIIPRHYKKPRFLENLQAILSDEGAVNLECKVIGVPQPVLKWYKDGEELKPGDIHRIISGQDGTCCLGTYTCEASNCMGVAASSASLLGFEDSMKAKEKKKAEEQALQRNLSLSTIHEERTSQMYDTPVGDITLDDKGEISFSFDGKEVSVSLYETPDLTEEEALQIVEMYADQLSENVTEHNVVELPPLRFVKETSTSGNLLMEAIIIDVSPEYFTSPEEDLRTEADVEDISIADENGPPQLSLDQDIDIAGEDYLEKTMALLSEEKADLPLKLIRKKSDSQRSAEDFFSLSREQSLSEEKRDDDTQALSESELHSFASAHSSSKPKSKSSKPSAEDGQESSEPTKTILFKDELQKSVEVEVEPAAVKPKRERRTSRGSRRSSSGSEKSISRPKEEPVKVKSEVKTETEAPKNPSMTDEEFRTKMSNVSASLTQVINDVQLIERDIILKSELMSSAATASRSLEIISSLITPLSEIHSIADAAKETATESKEVSSTLFNRLPQSLKSLHQSLTIIEKCIDVESDNRTLVKKTCVSFIENCGAEIQKLSSEIKSVTSTDYLSTDDKVLSEIDSLTKEMSTVIKFSADTIKAKNLLSEASEIKVEEPSLQTRHLRDTQKAVFELRTPLNSLLRIVESADSGKIVEISKIKSSDVILNDMSASIQDLQTSLEQIESLSVKESTSPALQKYNTEIIETVVDSILKLRNSFEKLSTDTKVDDKIALKETIKSIKENLNEISTQIGTIERNVGTFDVLQSDNKLDVLQKMAQILITLENNLPRLETMPEVKTHMESFHKNLTKVLENVIESNEAKKYFTLMEICDAVNRINSSIKDIDTENVLPLASLSNTLTIIKDNFVNNVFESELNCSVLTNITDVLVGIQEAINKAEEVSFQVESEHIQDLSPQVFDAMRANMVVEHIDQTIAAINTVRSIETTTEAKSSFAPVLETICPVLEDLRKYIASVGTLGTEHDEHISDISEASFAETLATPLCELNQNLIVLNQSIVENIVSLKESNVIISAVAEPLYELQKTLEIIQQEVISQYGEDLTPYEISVNMASAVQNLQSCILMIQEEAGIEGLDEMSTLEDISGIKTTADTIPSDRLVVPTAEETTTEQNLETFSEEVPKSATAKALHTLNEHIAILQNPEILDALDTLSEVSDYSSLKSVALGLGELHSGIQEILHPIIMERSSDISNLVNISKLATIAQPLHELQQNLSVLEMNNIPIYENILELPAEKLHSVIEKITDFKEHLDKCAQAIFPAIELADQSIEISNKIGTLRELCEHLKDIIIVTKDRSSDVPASKEVEALEEVVDTLIEATDPTTGIRIEKVKSITQELFEKVLEVQEELIQFTPQSPEKLAREAKLIDGMDEVEKSIAVLQEYDFVDLSRASDITSCTSPQLAMELDSDSLMQIDDLAANAVNVVQDSNQDMPIADLMIVEDFFKTCKNEFTILRCLISKTSSHKKIVRLLQEFNTLQTTVEEFKTKRFQLSLSDDVNGCLTSFLTQAEECLKNVRNSLVEIVNSQSELLFKEPTAQLNKSVEMLSKLVVEQKDKQLVEVVTKLCNVVLVTKPSMENIQVGVIQELQQPSAIKTREDNQLVKAMEQFMEYIEEQTKISSSIITSNTLKEVLKCIQKHQDFRDATPTGKVLIILKCLSSCADVLRERLLGYKQVEVTEHTAAEGKLRKVLTEMLEPLQVLHSQLVDIQHQVLSGVQQDLISIDIDSTESLVKAMTEKYKDIIQTLESEVTLVANEELSLIMEVDKEIHSIQNAIKSVEDVQATQAMVKIAKPIEIIEKSLQDIISSDKLALESNEKLPKDINSNIDSLECALERFINIEIDLMVASMLLVDIDVNESMQLAVELKSLLTLSPKELASPKVVEMKNESIASLKANLSKFDWLNTDECLKGKPLLQVEKLKRVFLTTYQLLTELNNVNQPAKTKFNEIKQEEKAAELVQHIDQYIELIEIVEEISAIIKIEDLKEAVDIAKELRESISTSEAMKEEETGEITHEISTEQACLALKLQRALMALHVQVLDSAQELAPELSTEVLQRIAKVTAQLQADLVAVTGVHVAVQAPSELIETVKCVESVEKETLTVQTVPTDAAIEETVATVLEQVEEVKAPEDDKNEAFVSIMEKESVQLQEIVAAEEEQPLVEEIKPESRIMPTAEEAESLASTTTEIVDQTLDRITEISPAEQACIKVVEETAVQYGEKILLEDITAIAMETGEEVADVITREQPAAVDVTERAVVEQIEELKLIDNVEQVTAKEIKEDRTQYQTEQDVKEVVAKTITAESSVTAEAAIFVIDEKADELNVGTSTTEDVFIAEIVKLVDEQQVTASEPKTLDSKEKVDIKSAEEILSVEITESAAIEKAEDTKVEEVIMDNQLAKATEQTTSDDQEPITSHDMAIVTSKEVVEQTTTQAEDTEELSLGKATSAAEKVTEISKQIADEQEPEKEAVVVQETLLVEEAKPVSEVLPDSAELKTVEQPAVEIIESLLLEAVSQTDVQENKIQHVAVRLSEEAIQEIQEIVAVEDIKLPEETKPENTDVMPTEQAAAETKVAVVVEDIGISKTEDIAKEHAIPGVAEVLSVAVASEAASLLEDITSQAEKAVDEIQESTTMEVADEKVEALVAQHPVPVTEDMKSPIDKLKQHIDEFVCENLVEEIQQLSNTPVIEGLKTTIATAKELKESIETLQPDVKEVTGEVKEISEAQTKLAQQLQTALSVIYQQALETLKESDNINRNTYEKIVEVSENLMADLIAVVNIAEVLGSVQEKDEVVAIESQVHVFEQQAIEVASMIITQTGTVGDTEAIKEKAIQTAEAKEEIEVKAGENAETLEKHVAVIEESIVVKSIDHRIMKSEDEKIDVDNARVTESAVSTESKALESEDLLPEEKGESLQSIAVSEETELVEFEEVSTDKPKSIIQEQAKESSEDALARACVETLIQHMNQLISEDTTQILDKISSALQLDELKQSANVAKELLECLAASETTATDSVDAIKNEKTFEEKAKLAQELQNALTTIQMNVIDKTEELAPVVGNKGLESVTDIVVNLAVDLSALIGQVVVQMSASSENNQARNIEITVPEEKKYIEVQSALETAEIVEDIKPTITEEVIPLIIPVDSVVNVPSEETISQSSEAVAIQAAIEPIDPHAVLVMQSIPIENTEALSKQDTVEQRTVTEVIKTQLKTADSESIEITESKSEVKYESVDIKTAEEIEQQIVPQDVAEQIVLLDEIKKLQEENILPVTNTASHLAEKKEIILDERVGSISEQQQNVADIVADSATAIYNTQLTGTEQVELLKVDNLLPQKTSGTDDTANEVVTREEAPIILEQTTVIKDVQLESDEANLIQEVNLASVQISTPEQLVIAASLQDLHTEETKNLNGKKTEVEIQKQAESKETESLPLQDVVINEEVVQSTRAPESIAIEKTSAADSVMRFIEEYTTGDVFKVIKSLSYVVDCEEIKDSIVMAKELQNKFDAVKESIDACKVSPELTLLIENLVNALTRVEIQLVICGQDLRPVFKDPKIEKALSATEQLNIVLANLITGSVIEETPSDQQKETIGLGDVLPMTSDLHESETIISEQKDHVITHMPIEETAALESSLHLSEKHILSCIVDDMNDTILKSKDVAKDGVLITEVATEDSKSNIIDNIKVDKINVAEIDQKVTEEKFSESQNADITIVKDSLVEVPVEKDSSLTEFSESNGIKNNEPITQEYPVAVDDDNNLNQDIEAPFTKAFDAASTNILNTTSSADQVLVGKSKMDAMQNVVQLYNETYTNMETEKTNLHDQTQNVINDEVTEKDITQEDTSTDIRKDKTEVFQDAEVAQENIDVQIHNVAENAYIIDTDESSAKDILDVVILGTVSSLEVTSIVKDIASSTHQKLKEIVPKEGTEVVSLETVENVVEGAVESVQFNYLGKEANNKTDQPIILEQVIDIKEAGMGIMQAGSLSDVTLDSPVACHETEPVILESLIHTDEPTIMKPTDVVVEEQIAINKYEMMIIEPVTPIEEIEKVVGCPSDTDYNILEKVVPNQETAPVILEQIEENIKIATETIEFNNLDKNTVHENIQHVALENIAPLDQDLQFSTDQLIVTESESKMLNEKFVPSQEIMPLLLEQLQEEKEVSELHLVNVNKEKDGDVSHVIVSGLCNDIAIEEKTIEPKVVNIQEIASEITQPLIIEPLSSIDDMKMVEIHSSEVDERIQSTSEKSAIIHDEPILLEAVITDDNQVVEFSTDVSTKEFMVATETSHPVFDCETPIKEVPLESANFVQLDEYAEPVIASNQEQLPTSLEVEGNMKNVINISDIRLDKHIVALSEQPLILEQAMPIKLEHEIAENFIGGADAMISTETIDPSSVRQVNPTQQNLVNLKVLECSEIDVDNVVVCQEYDLLEKVKNIENSIPLNTIDIEPQVRTANMLETIAVENVAPIEQVEQTTLMSLEVLGLEKIASNITAESVLEKMEDTIKNEKEIKETSISEEAILTIGEVPCDEVAEQHNISNENEEFEIADSSDPLSLKISIPLEVMHSFLMEQTVCIDSQDDIDSEIFHEAISGEEVTENKEIVDISTSNASCIMSEVIKDIIIEPLIYIEEKSSESSTAVVKVVDDQSKVDVVKDNKLMANVQSQPTLLETTTPMQELKLLTTSLVNVEEINSDKMVPIQEESVILEEADERLQIATEQIKSVIKQRNVFTEDLPPLILEQVAPMLMGESLTTDQIRPTVDTETTLVSTQQVNPIQVEPLNYILAQEKNSNEIFSPLILEDISPIEGLSSVTTDKCAEISMEAKDTSEINDRNNDTCYIGEVMEQIILEPVTPIEDIDVSIASINSRELINDAFDKCVVCHDTCPILLESVESKEFYATKNIVDIEGKESVTVQEVSHDLKESLGRIVEVNPISITSIEIENTLDEKLVATQLSEPMLLEIVDNDTYNNNTSNISQSTIEVTDDSNSQIKINETIKNTNPVLNDSLFVLNETVQLMVLEPLTPIDDKILDYVSADLIDVDVLSVKHAMCQVKEPTILDTLKPSVDSQLGTDEVSLRPNYEITLDISQPIITNTLAACEEIDSIHKMAGSKYGLSEKMVATYQLEPVIHEQTRQLNDVVYEKATVNNLVEKTGDEKLHTLPEATEFLALETLTNIQDSIKDVAQISDQANPCFDSAEAIITNASMACVEALAFTIEDISETANTSVENIVLDTSVINEITHDVTTDTKTISEHTTEHSLIEHINELTSDEVSEAIEKISAVANKEELMESVVAAKELRECVAALCANIEEEAGIMPASSEEKAQLAQKLLDSLIVLNTQILDNAQDLTPVIETSTLEKVASIITHLKEDLQTVVVIYEPGVFTADIQKICDIPEENSMKRLELLLQEVNEKINLASPDRNAEDSEVLRDTLDEVQTVIIKLKRDYDEAVNDALNETLEDLECSVRSVQLQINEDSPPELLKEACATLQLLLNNMSETQNMEISETVIKDKKSQTLLEKCSEETQETVKLLDDACKIEAKTHTKLANIVSDLNKLKETIKALRLNFLSDAQTIIDRGIDVTQSLDQVEDRVYSLEKDIDNERQMPSEVRDCIITAIHSVFGSISNMRSTISSIQKRYMFENYGKPSETLLRTIKNVSDIAKLDEEEKIPNWKKFSKSLRKVLNHFEDIKFYINLDKTARLPSDAAFTKIILEDLKLCINEVIITHEIMTKAEESKKVKDTLKCVDKYLGTIESKSALDVKEKIPIFKDIASRIYGVSDAIKKALKIFKVTEIEVELDEMTETDAKINAAVSEVIIGEESATKVEINQEKLDLQQAEMLDVEASESSLRHTEDVLVKDAIILIAAEIQDKTEESSDELSKLTATEMSTDTKQTEETVLIPEEDIKSEAVLQTIETVVLHKAEVAQAIADVQISPDIQKDEFVVVSDNEEKFEVMTISSLKEESSDQALQSIVEQKADAQTAKREKIELKAAEKVEETQERIEVEVVGDSQVQEQVVLDTERSRTQLEGSIDKNRENISQQDKYDTFETETNIVQEKHDDSLLVEEELKQSLVSTEEKKIVTELLRENNVSQKEIAQETAVPADNSIKEKLKIDANLEDISVQQEYKTTDDKSDETKIKKKKSPKKKAKSEKTSPGEEETKIEQIESEIVDTGRRSIKERKISDVEEKKEEEQTPTEEKAITVIEEVESPAVQEEKATACLHAGDVDKDDQSYKKEFERLDDEMKVNANKPEKLDQEKVIEQDKSKTKTIGKENIVQEEPEKDRLQKGQQNKVTVKSEIKEENLDNEKKEKVSLDKKEPEKESEGTEKLEKERMEREQLETKRLEKEQMETEILEKELLEKEHLDRAEVKKQQTEKERLEKEEQEKLVNKKEEKEKFRQDKKEKIKEEKQEERLEKELTEKEKIEKEQLEKRLEKEKLDKEQLEKERLEKEQLDKERLEKEQFEKEKIEKDKLEKDRLEKEKIEKEQLEKERLEKEQLENERLEKEKLEKEHLDKERLEKEKVQKKQLEKDRLEKEKLEKEQLEKERLEKEHLDKERLEKEQLEKEKVEREQLEKDRLEKEKLEKEQLEKERLEKEYLDKERLEKEQLEKEKVEREQLEKDRLEKEKLEEEQLEKERLEKEHLDKERLEKEHLDKERLEKEQFEKERLEKEKLDKEQIEKERLEKEHLNKERLEKEKLEKEVLEKERLEKEQLDKERLEKEKQEKDQLKKESVEKELIEKERLKKEELDREKIEKEQTEKIRLEKEEHEKLENEKQEKKKLRKEKKEKQAKEKLEKEKQEKEEEEQREKEKLEKEQLEKEVIETEKLGKSQVEKERVEKELLEKEKLQKEQQEKLERERLEKEKLEKEKEKIDRLDKESIKEEQLEKERLEKELLEKEMLEKEEHEKLECEKKENERLRKEKEEKTKREKEEKGRLEQENLVKEKEEKERLEKERSEKEQIDKERLEKDKLEKEKVENEEREKLESEKKEKEKLRKEKREKIKREREENERLEQEKLDKEKEEKDRLEKERLEKEQLDNERLEKERLEREKLEKEEHEKLENEKKEKERLRKEKKEKINREREEKERLEQEKLDKEKNKMTDLKKKG
ncbi:hypothetical protein O3G_MSEX004002 [Manduca sexta]|uniref:Ig-like domain-containing protein n=1 Tax=Manduca sexta TaxID=7130 RepID=A0A922CG67_MANSE|nr:hypothetical protein O3G_MSEX004002 [Manduca sexta]